ncbi:MAG: hypothetical protein IJO89_03990 [Clostridia bacterium]|nr:hypothetical protein [Clostridia bacterium]
MNIVTPIEAPVETTIFPFCKNSSFSLFSLSVNSFISRLQSSVIKDEFDVVKLS